MKIQVDQNNLLSISHPEIPQLKEYTYFAAWWKFSDWDKGVVVLHKKDFKVLNLKHLGDGMQLIYVKKDSLWELKFDLESFQQAFWLFHSFDEETGQEYSFLPWFPHKEIDPLNKKLLSLWQSIQCFLDTKWVLISTLPLYNIEDFLKSYLAFSLDYFWYMENLR